MELGAFALQKASDLLIERSDVWGEKQKGLLHVGEESPCASWVSLSMMQTVAADRDVKTN